MKNCLLFLLLSILFLGCSNKQKLYIYGWADYIDPSLIEKFERENNCQIVIDQFDDNETMFAKLLAGASGYDILFPSTYIINTFKQNDLIQKLDINKLANVRKNFDIKYNKFMYDKTMSWSIPYAFSMTGICYRKDKITCDIKSWDLLLNTNANNRVCILNDMREIIGIGLKKNGFAANSIDKNELDAALKTMLKYKSVVSKLDNIQYKSGIASSEFYICMGYNSDILQLVNEMPDLPIEFFIPNEGSTCCFDEMCIAKNSKNVDLAHKFIDFLYDAENAAINAQYICAIVPNKNIWQYIPEKFKNNPMFNVSTNVLSRLDVIQDVGDNLEIYNKFWDKFKISK